MRSARTGTSYGKVRGSLDTDPSISRLSDTAFRAFFRLVAYCAAHDLAGYIEKDVAGVLIDTGSRKAQRILAELSREPAHHWQKQVLLNAGPLYLINPALVPFGRDGDDWDRSEVWKVLERDGLVCRYCGIALAFTEVTIDHVMPRSRGGSDKPANLAVCCRRCNSSKGDRTPNEAGMVLR